MSNLYERFVKTKQRKGRDIMRTYKVYLIRHGMTAANLEGRYVGITDNDLCEEGVAEVLLMKEQYEYPNVGIVYSSPLKRALQTARLLYPDITPVTVSSLHECNFGDFENKAFAELKDNAEFISYLKDGRVGAPPNGESREQVEKRVVEGFDSIVKDMMSKKISEAVLVTHGGVINTLLTLCGLPKKEDWGINNATGYTAMINTALWANNKAFEIFTPIPFGIKPEEVMMDYQAHYFGNADEDAITE